MKHRTGSDFQTGGFLKEPGTYHFCIVDAVENPTNKDGALIDNAAFRIYAEALAGTAPGQENKQCDIIFFWPKPSDKNEGAFNRKKIDRFLLAIGLMQEEDKDKELDIDIGKAVGKQFIAKMELDEDNKFLRVSFADIYHVDDPAIKTVPKSESGLKLIHPSLRKIGEKPSGKPGRNGSARKTKAATEAAGAGSTAAATGSSDPGQAAPAPAGEGEPITGDWGGFV